MMNNHQGQPRHDPRPNHSTQHHSFSYSSLSIALLLIPLGVFLYYTSVGALERTVDSYLAALLGLDDY